MTQAIAEQSARRPIVVKIGGSAMGGDDTTMQDLAQLQRRGQPVVVVHGGGPMITAWMKKQGAMPRFVNGLRVTDAESLDIAIAVLTGLINKKLVAELTALGANAVGLSGVDGGLLRCESPNPELGYVGQVTEVNPEPLNFALQGGFMPLVAPLGLHRDNGQILNINGDTATGSVAGALNAERLIILTDVDGVLDGSGRRVPYMTTRQARMFLRSNIARGGMIPKLKACLDALERVPTAHIIDGRRPGALMECLEGAAIGTRVQAS